MSKDEKKVLVPMKLDDHKWIKQTAKALKVYEKDILGLAIKSARQRNIINEYKTEIIKTKIQEQEERVRRETEQLEKLKQEVG